MAGLFAQEENMTNASDFQAAMNASHPPATPDRSTWKKANGFALNPATNEWEPDVPAAPPPPPPPPAAAAAPPPPPPPPAAVPINPPPAAAAAPPPPPLSPAAASAPTPPPAAQADAEADHYEALAKGLEAAAAAVRALGNVPKPKRGRPAKG
jgi:hypothetical protein